MEYINNCPSCQAHQFTKFMETRDHFLSGEPFTIVRCDNCNLLFTNPRPGRDELPKYYESEKYISHSNTRKGLFSRLYQAIRNYSLRGKFRLLERHHGKGKLLDIGCGTGEFLSLGRKRGWQVTGMEPNPAAAGFARTRYDLEIVNDPSLQSFPDRHFDVVTLWHVLEHVESLPATFRQLLRILKDDGLLVIAVPNAASFDAVYYREFWAAWDLPRHLLHFTPVTLCAAANRHGLQLRTSASMIFDAFYISLLSNEYKYGKKNYPAAFLRGLQSNLNASRHHQNFSSLIFLFNKEKS